MHIVYCEFNFSMLCSVVNSDWSKFLKGPCHRHLKLQVNSDWSKFLKGPKRECEREQLVL